MSKRSKPGELAKMKTKKYEKELRKLQAELCQLQEWVKHKGLRVIIVFEGRDAAGKGGTIKAITERVSPRVFRVVALPAPSDREKSQMYIQRYMQHFPAAGEVVIFDRSWYNRAGVEYVMGFCTKEQHRAFLEPAPRSRNTSWRAASILIKIWLEVSDKEQKRRFEARLEDPLRQWKLSPMDLPSRSKWFEYSRARDLMLKATDTKWAPWYILPSDDKKRARLNCIRHILSLIPYKKVPREKIEAAQALDEGRLRRPGLAQGAEVRAGEVLNSRYSNHTLAPIKQTPEFVMKQDRSHFPLLPCLTAFVSGIAMALVLAGSGCGTLGGESPICRRRHGGRPESVTAGTDKTTKHHDHIKDNEKPNLAYDRPREPAGVHHAGQPGTTRPKHPGRRSSETTRTDAQLKATLDAINALTRQTEGDLRPAYNAYCSEVAKTQAAAAWTKTRVQWMASDGRKYFQDWQTTVNGIANESLRKKAQKRLDAVQVSYDKVEASLQQAGEKFKPFLSDLADIQKALASDVTPGGVKAIKSTVSSANWNHQYVDKAVKSALKEMDKMQKALSSEAK